MSTKTVFRRKIYQDMLKWKEERDGETALLIEGARRIGKSTIVEEFAKVSPIEVKSSGYKAHTSLDTFSEKYSSRIAHKYLVYTKDLKKDGDTLCVPIYMVPLLP